MLKTEDTGRVRTLTLARPEKLNAFSIPLYVALTDALASAAEDDSVHVVVLTGEGRAFSVGADLSQPPQPQDPPPDVPHRDIPWRFPKPLVAAVNGLAVGIGFTILGHCDFVFLAQGARLRAPFCELGLSPEASSSYLFPLRMGWGNAARALMLGEWLDPEAVVRMGLAQQVVPDEQLMAEAMAFAARLAERPLQSLVATKQLMLEAHAPQIEAARVREQESMARLLGTPANLAAVAAFQRRRKAAAGDKS